MRCEWRRVRGEHPPPILARASQGARAFIFSKHPLSARWACVLSGTLASPQSGALTVWVFFYGWLTGVSSGAILFYKSHRPYTGV